MKASIRIANEMSVAGDGSVHGANKILIDAKGMAGEHSHYANNILWEIISSTSYSDCGVTLTVAPMSMDEKWANLAKRS